MNKLPKARTKTILVQEAGETATFLSRCVVTLGGLGGGFALSYLSRSAA